MTAIGMRKRSWLAWVLGLGALAGVSNAAAQAPASNQQILDELRQIRLLVEKLSSSLPGGAPAAAPVAQRVTLADIDGPVLGRPDAPLTMVEFTDLQCPYCRQFHLTTFEQIRKAYIDTGKLRYVSRDFPLDAIHTVAMDAARAVRCAGEQGKFWELRHQVLLNNARLTPGLPTTLADDLHLDMAAFDRCINAGTRFDEAIKKDVAAATSVGISGTPSFVIGPTRTRGVEGVLIVGAQPFAAFDAKLKELLATAAR